MKADRDTEVKASVVIPTEGQTHPRTSWVWQMDTRPQNVVIPTEPQNVVIPTEGEPHLRVLLALVRPAQHILERTPVAVVAVVVALVTLFVHGYQLSMAPDVF